jgi:hypothetical protein
LSAVFDRLIKTHISLRLGYGSSLGALWELSGSSLGAHWELVAVAGILILNLIKRQSERDFPRGSLRNGLIDGTKCQSLKQKGNFVRLLCIAHTTNGSHIMKRSFKYSDAKWKQNIKFMKLYLCMEE